MTSKRIEYDPHAVARMRQRSLTRSDVRWLLARGLPCPTETLPGRERRFCRTGVIRRRSAEVVYLENAVRVYVITVAWVDDETE